MFTADPEHPPIQVGEFTEKIALLRANDDEGLEDESSVRREEGERAGEKLLPILCLYLCIRRWSRTSRSPRMLPRSTSTRIKTAI